jgi:hypothetical protein
VHSRTSKARSVSSPRRAAKADPFLHLNHLFDELEKAVEPIGHLPGRVWIRNYSDASKAELAELQSREDQTHSVIKKEFDTLGIDRTKVWTILYQWWNPFHSGTVEQLALAMKGGRDKLRRDIKRVMTVERVVVKIGPLPAPVRERFLTHRDRFLDSLKSALESLNKELIYYQQAIQILKRAHAHALNRRPRTTLSTTGSAVQALYQLLSRKVPERLRRAQLIYSLLHAWNPRNAPSSPETIRTGYR